MAIPEILKDKIRTMSSLPTLPQIASNIMTLINDHHSSSKDLAVIISQDVSLSAKILRLSNSAFYGIPRQISNINDAIVILGFNVIYTLVLSLTVFDLFPKGKISCHFNRKLFWDHCLMSGVIAKIMIKKYAGNQVQTNDAFCAGLLHDIGKIVMEQYFHEDLINSLDYSMKTGKSHFQAEKKLLGFTHSDVTEILISHWNLPEILFYPLVYHHCPDTLLSHDFEHVKQSHVANTFVCHIADYLGHKYIGEQRTNHNLILPELHPACLSYLGIEEQDLDAIQETIPEEWEKVTVFSSYLVA